MTNNQLTDEELQTLIIELQQTAYRLNGTNSAYLMSDAIKPLRELQERRKAAMDSEPVAWISQSNLDALSRGHDALVKSTDNVVQPVPLYRHAQPAPVVPESICVRQAISALERADEVTTIAQAYKLGWNAFRAAMLQSGNSPVIPDGYVMVPKALLSELRDWAHPEIEKYCEMWEGRRDSEFPALRKVIADADALLAAAPQESKS
ncbi:hypothetical protein J2W63_003159 [Klebsiella sp. 1400]|uniref:hypothetical protein n=1 Tax=Klebsiella sp. 1400 TaxID=2817712 RepID=UPI00285871E8|nr:hypothetical protein [Klebsiella sp. 1400]MDR6617413.1 hypothetical protein [Klebsiella sp. 1400]